MHTIVGGANIREFIRVGTSVARAHRCRAHRERVQRARHEASDYKRRGVRAGADIFVSIGAHALDENCIIYKGVVRC